MGNEILTRLFVWKQSHTGLLGESTSSVFLVCEVLGEVEESADGLAQAVLEDLSEGLRRHFGAEAVSFLVEERFPAASWSEVEQYLGSVAKWMNVARSETWCAGSSTACETPPTGGKLGGVGCCTSGI